MRELAEELSARSVVGPAGVAWARAFAAEHQLALDTAMLALDLVDEEEMLAAQATSIGLPPASAEDLAAADPALAEHLPETFSRTLGLCPVRLADRRLTVLVDSALPEESEQELLDLFGLEVDARAAASHHLTIARGAVYGTPVDEVSAELEQRLQRRRLAVPLPETIAKVTRASTPAAAAAILEHAQRFVEFACLFFVREDGLRVLTRQGGGAVASPNVPSPRAGCSLRAALIHGGYFLGPLPGTPEDRAFYASLGRGVPAWAFVAPVPGGGEQSIALYGDNGARGIASRWGAELTLLATALGRPRPPSATPAPEPEPPPEESSAGAAPPGPGSTRPGLSGDDWAAVQRLRSVAEERGLSLAALVDELLEAPAPAASPDQALALFGEVRTMFEKLATEIPAQLARGMEPAFRDLVHRLGPAAVAGHAPAAPRPAVDVDVQLVKTDGAPREVEDYRSRRRKSKRVKM